ncbi:MAG TPA: hypothetical protein VFY92_02690, partial [Hyphomicrobiaceae bacterium]|nr:hypothetical protein [Hyphomicrobiaceae bacterium]
MGTLTITDGFRPALYQRMREAIAACHDVDECKDVADRALAMATYYEQANDQESIRKVHEIKLRAWRRIGELLLNDPKVKAAMGADARYRVACERFG